MTCIVGVTDGKNIWMGGDSLTGNSEYTFTVKNQKVTKRKIGNMEILIGSSGTHRGGYLVDKMTFPELTVDIDTYMCIDVPNAIREVYKEAGYLTVDRDKNEHDCTFIFGIDGRLFSMWQDFGMVEFNESYVAIGSGMYFALGSLHTTHKMEIEPEERVRLAIMAAVDHSPYVSLPIHIEKI